MLNISAAPGDVAERISILKIMLKCLSGKTDCTPIKKELIGLAAKFEEFCKNFLSKKDEVGLQKLYDQLLRNNVEVWEKAEEHKKFFSMGD